VVLARDLLKLALHAVRLRHHGAWRELAGVMTEIGETQWALKDFELDQAKVVRDLTKPLAEYAVRWLDVCRSASEQAARRRLPTQQHRVACFATAIQADPEGCPKRWASTVAPLAFGRSDARHVENAQRWQRRHRGEVEAARTNADSPAECPAPGRSG
jgi:hypothetical protein